MLKMEKNILKANAITHSGSFHADDVFSAVFLSKIMPELILCRVNELPENWNETNSLVFDVGGGEFDHHGIDAKIRENKIKYSAFGLLFEKFGCDFLKRLEVKNIHLVYESILKDFILQIDAFDNGIFPKSPDIYTITSLSTAIELFNPSWKELESSDDSFKKAFLFAEMIFDRIIKRIVDKVSAKDFVEAAIEKSKDHILILDTYMPFMEFVLTSENDLAKDIIYAIFPSNREGYNIRAVNKEIGSHANRLNFPKEWGGKTEQELKSLTNISTFRFCHSNLFLCACGNLEDAKKIASLALKEKK